MWINFDQLLDLPNVTVVNYQKIAQTIFLKLALLTSQRFVNIRQSSIFRSTTPPPNPRVDSFKLSTADFESINLTEDSHVYLSLIKRVSHNN